MGVDDNAPSAPLLRPWLGAAAARAPELYGRVGSTSAAAGGPRSTRPPAVQIVRWFGFTVIPFFAPSPLIQLYGKVAHFGAGAFLVIQLISVTIFITWLNDCCRSENNLKRCAMVPHPEICNRKAGDLMSADWLNITCP